MFSPFPGMDPFLEHPAFWPSFHSRFIVALADAIEPSLMSNYYVEVEARTYLDSGETDLLIGLPDAVVASGRSQEPPLSHPTASTIAVQNWPQQVQVPLPEEVTERYLEIRELETGDVITAIELLSPKNKRSGKGRTTYKDKRNQKLGSFTHLIELDWLRSGEPMPILGKTTPTPYRILVSPSDQRPKADLYGITLQQPLPNIPIPLKSDDPPILLPLQPIFNGVYNRGRYRTRIDYTQSPPPPKLPKTEQDWLFQHLQSQEG